MGAEKHNEECVEMLIRHVAGPSALLAIETHSEYIISCNVREYAGIQYWFSVKSFTRLIARGRNDQNALTMAAAQEETASLSRAVHKILQANNRHFAQPVYKLGLQDVEKGVITVKTEAFLYCPQCFMALFFFRC